VKIVHVSDCYLPRPGGIERQVHDLAVRQQEAGHDVEIITSSGADDQRDGEGAQLRVHRLADRGGAGSIHYATSLRGAALAAARQFDAMHVHLSTCSPLALLAARAGCHAGVPVAATVHSMWARATPFMRACAGVSGWRRWPIAWSAVSAAASREVLSVLGGRSVAVLPNGVDAGEWVLPVRVPDPQRVVIASVMRLVPRKRPRQLLQILAQLRRQVAADVHIEAVLVGNGALRPQLETDLRRLGMTDWVTLTGTLTRAEIASRYRDCDIYVAPAKLESFGIAALEARAAGLPIVARTGTGVAEFVQHDVHGLLVRDDAAMVRALRELVVNPGLRASFAASSRAHPPMIDWPRVLEGCDALYARAIALRQSAAGDRLFARAAP
jgi:glycosyltransferase involved in cell wall biosynthesis